jgi:hypothetical protein
LAAKEPSPKVQLAAFLAKFTPETAALAKAVLTKMRARLPGAVELVYDNYNALAIGFGPTERASEAIFSIAVFPRWVSLFFLYGAALPDPKKVLKGSGNKVRHIVIKNAAELDAPAIRDLMARALKAAAKPPDGKGRGRIVIKAISAKQRPRRPA